VYLLNVDAVLTECCPGSCRGKAMVYHENLLLHCGWQILSTGKIFFLPYEVIMIATETIVE